MVSLYSITLVAFLVLISGAFSAMELAYFSLSHVRIRKMVKQNIPGASQIERIKKDPDKLITTILIGNTIVNISASTITTGIALEYFGSIGIGIATGLLTLLILTFGEIIPKTLAVRYSEDIARYSLPFLQFSQFILSPLITLFNFIPMLLIGKFNITKPIVTEKEIRAILEIGVDEKAIEESERQLIYKLLDFRDKSIASVMVPMENVISIPSDISVSDAKEFAIKKGFSRYPIYSKFKGKIIGIVHIKHLDWLIAKGKGDMIVGECCSGLVSVPESEKLDILFRKMQKEHVHMVVITDAKQNQIGIITFEDLIEEIFGEIYDEKDSGV